MKAKGTSQELNAGWEIGGLKVKVNLCIKVIDEVRIFLNWGGNP